MAADRFQHNLKQSLSQAVASAPEVGSGESGLAITGSFPGEGGGGSTLESREPTIRNTPFRGWPFQGGMAAIRLTSQVRLQS